MNRSRHDDGVGVRGRSCLRLLMAALFAGPVWACSDAPGSVRPGADITASDMRARITFLASDHLRGRATPSRGLEVAAQYVESEFRRFGLEPVGNRYVHRYQLIATEMGGGWSLEIEHGGRLAALQYDRDFWGLPWAAGSVEGPLRAVGSRRSAVGEELAGTVWLARLGQGVMPREWLDAAAEGGAVGLLFVAPPDLGPQLRKWLTQEGSIYELGTVRAGVPAAVVSEGALNEAMERVGLGRRLVDARSSDRSGVARLSADLRAQTSSAPNVMAVLPGRDPSLRQEFVLVSAHMDGLGVGLPVGDDSIYNGADDNASGTSAVLEVAEALAALPRAPRRSIMFLTVSGEERGLLGSADFVENPPVALEKVVANVNIDMIGRNWEDTIAVVGKPYSSLGALVDSVAAAHPEIGMVVVGDRWPTEGFFFRSDHFNFARKGIPSVFFFNGVHEDYHRPSDEVERIKFKKSARIARLIREVVLALGEADRPPRWEMRARAAIVEEGR